MFKFFHDLNGLIFAIIDSIINYTDRLLRLAISNLLANAVKYNISERGEISVDVRFGEGACGIVVTNTGPEISEENRERIFERFFRGDPARAAAKRGFGLGLSLSRVIAGAHGGELELLSSSIPWVNRLFYHADW